jgi:hypothetical protein
MSFAPQLVAGTFQFLHNSLALGDGGRDAATHHAHHSSERLQPQQHRAERHPVYTLSRYSSPDRESGHDHCCNSGRNSAKSKSGPEQKRYA